MREFVNKVVIEGYLRENNLEAKRTDSGDDVVSGSVIVALDEHNSIRTQIYVRKQKRDAQGNVVGENAQYAKLVKMLPQYTSTIATALSSNKDLTFNAAAEVASKVYVIGTLQEYIRGNAPEAYDYSIRAFSFGFKTIDAAHPFNPHSTFDVECMVKAVQVDPEGNNVKIIGVVPEPYSSQGASILKFVVNEPTLVDQAANLYAPQMTARIAGYLVNSYSVVKKEAAPMAFGTGIEGTTETVFTHELIVTGGAYPVDSDNPTAFQIDEMRDLLAKREVAVAERVAEAQKNSAKPSAPAMPQGQNKNWAFSMPTATAPAKPVAAAAAQPPVMATPVVEEEEDNIPPWGFENTTTTPSVSNSKPTVSW